MPRIGLMFMGAMDAVTKKEKIELRNVTTKERAKTKLIAKSILVCLAENTKIVVGVIFAESIFTRNENGPKINCLTAIWTDIH